MTKPTHLKGHTPEQIRNLATLALYLRDIDLKRGNVPARFSMRYFAHGRQHDIHFPAELKPECGTACCAVGHGPLAGIKAGKFEEWGEYMHRCFLIPGNHTTFRFLFCGAWEDNPHSSRMQAANRIAYYLLGGVPVGFTRPWWRDEIYDFPPIQIGEEEWQKSRSC